VQQSRGLKSGEAAADDGDGQDLGAGAVHLSP
jgi:hypothetical protein